MSTLAGRHSVDLRNIGSRDVDEAVLVFVRQRFRPAITPEVKLLKGFTKVAVKAGQTIRATVSLMTQDISYWTPQLRCFIDAGRGTAASCDTGCTLVQPSQTVGMCV